MVRKIAVIIAIVFIFFVLQSCQSKPEESVLKRYIHADNLKDKMTMSTMALEPISIGAETWEIVKVSEEKVETASLADLNKKELEFKKQVEESVGITLDAKDEVDLAEEELKNARTAADKRAAQKKVNEEKAKYEAQRERHDQVQLDYNKAKQAAAREEEIASFSLGAGNLLNIRDLTGQVHSKDVEIKAEGKAGTKNYIFYLRKYNLRDETLNLPYHGRWIIVKIESVS